MTEKLLADYKRFHAAQVASDDMDPVYPWMRVLADGWDLDDEERAWFVFCHVIWYHPGSTLVGFELMPDVTWMPGDEQALLNHPLTHLPTETERRSHRPKQPLVNHLLSLRSTFMEEGCWAWANRAMGDSEDPKERWLQLNDALTGLVGNGRWAAYKTAEMLQKVCDLPVEAADAGHAYSSGPRKGLAVLFPNEELDGNGPEVVAHADFLTDTLADELGETDIARVETSLCDFNSMVHGRYYTGHDIDSMLHALQHDALYEHQRKVAYDARAAVFNVAFLGEFWEDGQGWSGVRKDLNVLYRETGELYRG